MQEGNLYKNLILGQKNTILGSFVVLVMHRKENAGPKTHQNKNNIKEDIILHSVLL